MFRREAVTMSVLDHPHICNLATFGNQLSYDQQFWVHATSDHNSRPATWGRLFDVIEDSEQLYFVMELCEGGDLQHYLQACKEPCVPESSAACLMRQLLCAIRYMHGRSLAHSDFAARNVLLLENDSDVPLEHLTAKLAETHLNQWRFVVDFEFFEPFASKAPLCFEAGSRLWKFTLWPVYQPIANTFRQWYVQEASQSMQIHMWPTYLPW